MELFCDKFDLDQIIHKSQLDQINKSAPVNDDHRHNPHMNWQKCEVNE